MNKVLKVYGWAAAIYAALIYGYLGQRFLFDPSTAKLYGLSFGDLPAGYGFVRTSIAAMFLGLSLTALIGLFRPEYLATSLFFIVVMNGTIVATRVYGIIVDGETTMTMSELRDEGVSWVIFITGLLAWLWAERRAA